MGGITQEKLKALGRGMAKLKNQEQSPQPPFKMADGVNDGGEGPKSGRGYKKRKSVKVY